MMAQSEMFVQFLGGRNEHVKVTRHSRLRDETWGRVKCEAAFAGIERAVEGALEGEEAECCGCRQGIEGPGRKGYVGYPGRGRYERPNGRYWWLSCEMEERWRGEWMRR